MAKPKYTLEELAADPSLKWCPYRRFEILWSDTHQTCVRFVRYEGDGVVVAADASCAEMPGSVPKTSVRRPSAGQDARAPLPQDQKEAMVALQKSLRRLRNTPKGPETPAEETQP
jgi:hypothetical protein